MTRLTADRRKYWDEEYVRGLEQKVETLLKTVEHLEKEHTCSQCRNQVAGGSPDRSDESISGDAGPRRSLEASLEVPHGSHHMPDPAQYPPTETPRDADARSPEAMEELSVMMWRTNLGDGVPITHEAVGREPLTADSDTTSLLAGHFAPSPEVLWYCKDGNLLEHLAQTFLMSINQEHQFTTYTSTSFLEGYPFQPLEKVFLHTAILAVGASFLSASDDAMARAGEGFARYAERLVFECCRLKPTLAAIQGTTMLSFRSLALGRDHMGWTFISIAGGLSVHLRLHVLAVDEMDAGPMQPTVSEIRTFWMYYFVDRSAITILGRNCALPWRRVNVPSFDTTFDLSAASLEEISFAWQCRLWYTHDSAMDQM